MARVRVDGREYEFEAGQNLLHACLSARLDLPYFCWHPAMGSVGSCRLCAVMEYADADDQRGRLQMACTLAVRPDMRVSIEAPFAADFRKQVIEWLMENHPHDCPVCEEGGECHLQDMTVLTGHSMRRYAGAKRTWRNQYLGPFVGHEMNRCITCYRCVRYYRDYAGGTDLDAFGSRSRMFFGRGEDGTLESEFAGNLVEVCPTGVFTDKPFSKIYTRKWDLQSAPSVCPHCAVGCNTFASERYGQLRRVTNRYHSEVNGYFLCDRGRFGSHFVNHDKRLRLAGVRGVDGVFEAGGAETALARAAARCGGELVGIGSPRASLEANFALREFVGEENYCVGVADDEEKTLGVALEILRKGGFRVPSLTAVEQADAVLILGENIADTAPRMALAVRQATRGATLDMARAANIPEWQDAGVRGHGQGASSPLFVAAVASTRLDELATATRRGAAEELAAAGFAVAAAIDGDSAAGDDHFVAAVAQALAAAERPLVVAGCEARSPDLLRAAANVVWALTRRGRDAALAIAGAEANSFGVALLGGGLPLSAALERMREGAAALVVENDLHRRAPAADIALDDAVILDSLETRTAENAAVVLPAAAYAEQTGTFVNYETRAQRFYQVFEPQGEALPSWRWIRAIAERCERDGQPRQAADCAWSNIDALTAACASASDDLRGLAEAAPDAKFRTGVGARIPRQPHRYSGRTAMLADVSVHEPKAPVDAETPLAYSMEGENTGEQPGAVIPYVWSPGWNSNQAVFKFQQEVGGALAGGDPGVRLLGDAAVAPTSYEPPATGPARADDGFRAARVHDVFGSGELAGYSPPVLERAPAPYALLNSQDARDLGVEAGGGVRVEELDASLEVRLDDEIPRGVVALAQGWPGVPALASKSARLTVDLGFARRPGADPKVIAKG